jgi:periplasmic divalent cation tolerance protein
MAAAKHRHIIVFVTAADEENAVRIGRALVAERLAACANLIGPIRSIYRWQDAIEDEREHLLLIKTRAGLFSAVQTRIKELHPYQVPEIIAVDIEKGSAQYLEWLSQSTLALPARKMRKAAAPRRSVRT